VPSRSTRSTACATGPAHYSQLVKHELGWADEQMRPERAIVRHWQLVLLAYTFSLLVGAPPTPPLSQQEMAAGGKIGTSQRRRVRGAGHERSPSKPRHLEPGVTPGAGVVMPVGRLGSAAALLEALVERRPRLPAARAGRAPRPRGSLPAA
jgi:hypothetical protein